MSVTEDALREAATCVDGRWVFRGSEGFSHSEAEALAIAEACLLLGVPVTDRLTSAMFLKLVDRLAALDERLARIERGQQ